MVAPLVLGRIVWAEIPDANGIIKLRPAIIVTPTERITPTGAIEVVAISSRISQPIPDDHVMLPWHAQGHPRTGLNRPSAAVCKWRTRILPSDVQDVAGLVPGESLIAILARLADAGAPGMSADATTTQPDQ